MTAAKVQREQLLFIFCALEYNSCLGYILNDTSCTALYVHLNLNMFGVLRYLTGNPSTDFIGYRKYVIATLPQLKSLDGQDIERSERILAVQEFDEVKKLILSQEQEYEGLS
jgi:hypothetical protein